MSFSLMLLSRYGEILAVAVNSQNTRNTKNEVRVPDLQRLGEKDTEQIFHVQIFDELDKRKWSFVFYVHFSNIVQGQVKDVKQATCPFLQLLLVANEH